MNEILPKTPDLFFEILNKKEIQKTKYCRVQSETTFHDSKCLGVYKENGYFVKIKMDKASTIPPRETVEVYFELEPNLITLIGIVLESVEEIVTAKIETVLVFTGKDSAQRFKYGVDFF